MSDRGREPANAAARPALRDRVRHTLAKTRSYQSLDPKRREEVARNMETTLAFLQEAGVADAMLPVARAMQGTGDDFTGGAAREGAAVMKNLVRDVDFPSFVSNLIQGVFRSIVDSSVQQMQEYAKFLESVVKSVDQFARESVSEDEARDNLVSRFPSALERKADEGGPSRLGFKADLDDKDMPDFESLFGLSEKPDLDDEESEARLVHAGRLEMAKQRQQLLATMVLLGINRIVVTEGEIKASVMFDVRSHDTASRGRTRDRQRTGTDVDVGSSASSAQVNADDFQAAAFSNRTRVFTRVSTEHATSAANSASSLDAKANLSGAVTVKFKSETFPLERMASPMELASLNQKAAR